MADLKAKEVLERLGTEQKIDLYNRYALNLKGSYSFHEGDEYKVTGNIAYNMGMIENAVLDGRLALSDYFIAYAVAILGAADMTTIKMYLQWYGKRFPKKIVPSKIASAALESRLKVLASSGIVRKVAILDSDGVVKAGFYTSSELGAKAVKRVLDINTMGYDAWPLLDRTFRMYRRLVTSRVVTQLLANSDAQLDVNCFSELYDKDSKLKYSVYAQITATEPDDKKTLLIVEPVMFECDETVKSREEHLNDIRERLRFLGNHVANVINAEEDKRIHDDVRVIFVISDYDALTELVKMVLDTSIVLAEHSYYTSDRLISLNDGNLCRSFYGVNFVEDGEGRKKPRIEVAKNEGLLGVEDGKNLKLTEDIVVKLGYASN